VVRVGEQPINPVSRVFKPAVTAGMANAWMENADMDGEIHGKPVLVRVGVLDLKPRDLANSTNPRWLKEFS
jgi:hypothetical protein